LKIPVCPAIEDSAAGETIFVNGAFAGNVIGTAVSEHWFYIFTADICGQIHQFRQSDKEAVVEFGKITTLAAGSAKCGVGITDLQIQPGVNFSYFLNGCLPLVFCPPFFLPFNPLYFFEAVKPAFIDTATPLRYSVPGIRVS
jgi:hypothetical protein